MPYLFDSDVMVDLARGSSGADRPHRGPRRDVVNFRDYRLELPAGARTQRETTDLDLVLSGYRAIPPNEDIARRAYYLMKTYARSHGLHTIDALIGATL